MLDCKECRYNYKSPFTPLLDECRHPEVDDTFSNLARTAGDCGDDAQFFLKGNSLPRIVIGDYMYYYLHYLITGFIILALTVFYVWGA